MILGACSLCGGTVEVPDAWMGIDPPRPRCRRCNATKKLAVIEMDEPRTRYGADATSQGFKAEAVSGHVFPAEITELLERNRRQLESYYESMGLTNIMLDDAEYLNKVGNG